VRRANTTKLALAAAGLAAVLVSGWITAGCTTTTGGEPIARPPASTEVPTPRPGRTPPPATTKSPQPSTTTSAPTPTPGAQELPPNSQGYVFIETKSGKTRCQISRSAVGCEAEFTNSPMQDGMHANGVSIAADGDIRWLLGNLGDIPVVKLDYQTYRAQGWTIDATSSGTRFTNDGTGHGGFVSVDNVETF
jgi:hypothetical protein